MTELQKAFTKHFAKLKVIIKKINVQDLLEDEVVEKEEEDSRLSSVSEASGSTSPVYPTMITKEINSEPSTSFATSDTVSCPVCLTLVLKKNINHHLDNGCKTIQKKEDIVKGNTLSFFYTYYRTPFILTIFLWLIYPLDFYRKD